MKIIAHDFETTDQYPATAEVIQNYTAIIDVGLKGDYGEIICDHTSLWRPDTPISEGATAVHGFSNEDVKDCESWTLLGDIYVKMAEDHQPICTFGYNNRTYDDVILRRLVPSFTLPCVDVYIAVRRLRQAGRLSNGKLSLVYEELTGNKAVNAHDAAADVEMTFELVPHLMKLLGQETFEEFAGYVQSPLVDVNMLMPYGKHKGKLLKDIPYGYRKWLMDNASTHDEDVIASLQRIANG